MNKITGKPRVDVLGVGIDPITLPEALAGVSFLIRSQKNHYIVTPNPEMVMYAKKHKWFREILNGASLSLADGSGIMWAAKYLSLPLVRVPVLKHLQEFWQWLWTGLAVVVHPKGLNVIPERLTGTDMIWEISKLASERNYRIFLLGAAPGVAMKAAQIMQTLYPKLNVVEVMVGEPYETEFEVIRAIEQTKPQIIFLAYPADKQIKWIRDVLPKLSNVIAMGIGGGLDFIVQATALNATTETSPAVRAPKLMRDHSLEWLWRLITQPWRKERVKVAIIDFMRAVRKAKIQSW